MSWQICYIESMLPFLEIFRQWGLASWSMLLDLSLWLILGLLLSGILHVWVPVKWIQKHLSQDGFRGVLKAALIGMPLPLCSCGVIPVATHLRRSGAGRGSTTAFLVSTPVTGLDSILVTNAMMGPVIAVVRPVASVLAGVLAGLLAGNSPSNLPSENLAPVQLREKIYGNFWEKLGAGLRYAWGDLFAGVAPWILLGIVLAGFIDVVVPEKLIAGFGASGIWPYLVMMLIGLPVYVCATGSLPIAAVLLSSGISPGAVLVFLISGPAANVATISFVAGFLGRRSLFAYLSSIFIVSMLAGILLDWFFPGLAIGTAKGHSHLEHDANFVQKLGAVFLAMALLWHVRTLFFRPRKKHNLFRGNELTLFIPNIDCRRCKQHIEEGLQSFPGLKFVEVNVENRTLLARGELDEVALRNQLKTLGYPAQL